MKKASTKASTTTASIGTKRTCPECATKFYDFNKDPIHCPKCEAKVDVNALFKPSKSSEPKKPKKELPEEALMETEDVVVEGANFESVEDLDDDDEGVEDIEVEDEAEKEDY